MTTEFNLSEHAEEIETSSSNFYSEQNVKEFIRLLKDEILPDNTENPFILYSDVCSKINKLAGDKLI